MWAAALTGDKEITIIEQPKPKVDKYRDVLIRVLYCGICGSDTSKFKSIRSCQYPLVLGHEFCGVVEKGPTELIGKLVTAVPLWYCGTCESCLSGMYQTCSNHKFVGSTINGAMSEYITVPHKYVYECNDLADSPCLAALIEPLAVAVHAITLAPSYTSNSKIAIIGGGAIGTLIKTVYEHKVKNSQITIINKGEQIKASSYDICFECSGTVEGLESAIIAAKPRACILQVGILYSKSFINSTFNFDKLMRKELTIKSCWNSNLTSDWHIAYSLLKEARADFMRLISIFKRDKINEAFNTVPTRGVKKMIDMTEQRKIIAIDFDGTITDDTPYPITGKIRPEAVEVIKKLQKKYTCVLWTCRWGADLIEAINLLACNGIVFDYVNELPDAQLQMQRKIKADIYIDDKGYGAVIDWKQIEKDLLGE